MKSLFSILILTLLSCRIAAQDKVTINPDNRHQTIEFFGAADAWSGNFDLFSNSPLVQFTAVKTFIMLLVHED